MIYWASLSTKNRREMSVFWFRPNINTDDGSGQRALSATGQLGAVSIHFKPGPAVRCRVWRMFLHWEKKNEETRWPVLSAIKLVDVWVTMFTVLVWVSSGHCCCPGILWHQWNKCPGIDTDTSLLPSSPRYTMNLECKISVAPKL